MGCPVTRTTISGTRSCKVGSVSYALFLNLEEGVFVEVPDCRIVCEIQCPTTWNINTTFRLRDTARV